MYLNDLHKITGFSTQCTYTPLFEAIGISIMYANVLVILTVCVVEIFELGMKVLATEITFRFAYYCISFYY